MNLISRLLLALALSNAAFAAATDKKLPLPGEIFLVADRPAFLIPAKENVPEKSKPWVWYAPTLPPYPGAAEKWMFEKCHACSLLRPCAIRIMG